GAAQPMEEDQVGRSRRVPELTKVNRYLTAVVGGVVHHVPHELLQWSGERLAPRVAVLDRGVQRRIAERLDELRLPRLVLPPGREQPRAVLEVVRRRRASRRAAV